MKESMGAQPKRSRTGNMSARGKLFSVVARWTCFHFTHVNLFMLPRLAKLLYLVDQHLKMFLAPQIGSGSHFIAKIIEELGAVRNLLPDLRQEGRATKCIAQDDSIHMRSQFG